MRDEQIKSLLAFDRVDPFELDALLLDHFGRGSGSTSRYKYARNDGESALVVSLNKRGAISKLSIGPDLQPDDIGTIAEKVRSHLLGPRPRQVMEKVLFSVRKTTGCHREGDHFQIRPVPAEAPQPQFSFGDYPLILEVGFDGSSDPSIAGLRGAKRFRETELLLATLVNHRIHSSETNGNAVWVLDQSDGMMKSIYRQSGYIFEGRRFLANEFTDIESHTPIEIVKSDQHYSAASVDGISVFDLPETLPLSLRNYAHLTPPGQAKFLRASYWLQHSQQVWSLSKSASYVALVSAIEALVPKQASQLRCNECGAPTGSGPTDRFVQFLETIFPGQLPPETRKHFYRMRSNLAHGDALLHQDEDRWSMGMRGMDDWHLLYNLSQTVRAALVNWLHGRGA